jgi:hypothetical protein
MKSDKENIANQLILKSPEGRDFYDKVYHPQKDKVLKEICNEKFSVLVWGPGKGEDRYTQDLVSKRLEIINNLRKLGFDAFTSEEESKEMVDVDIFPQQAQEFLQALPVDLIINIGVSYGSLAELHDFAKNKGIASKMMVFFDREKIQGSYSPNSVISIFEALGGRTIFFDYPKDIKECNIWKEILSTIRALQYLKYLHKQNKKVFGYEL